MNYISVGINVVAYVEINNSQTLSTPTNFHIIKIKKKINYTTSHTQLNYCNKKIIEHQEVDLEVRNYESKSKLFSTTLKINLFPIDPF